MVPKSMREEGGGAYIEKGNVMEKEGKQNLLLRGKGGSELWRIKGRSEGQEIK